VLRAVLFGYVWKHLTEPDALARIDIGIQVGHCLKSSRSVIKINTLCIWLHEAIELAWNVRDAEL